MGKRRTGLYVHKTEFGKKGGEPVVWKYREGGNPRTVWIERSERHTDEYGGVNPQDDRRLQRVPAHEAPTFATAGSSRGIC